MCIVLHMVAPDSKGDVCRVHIDLQAPNHTVYLNEHYVLQRMSSKHRDQHVQKQQTSSPLLLTTKKNKMHSRESPKTVLLETLRGSHRAAALPLDFGHSKSLGTSLSNHQSLLSDLAGDLWQLINA